MVLLILARLAFLAFAAFVLFVLSLYVIIYLRLWKLKVVYAGLAVSSWIAKYGTKWMLITYLRYFSRLLGWLNRK